jgi:hypothetical protein
MYSYISKYLQKNNTSTEPTHLIAIPMEACNELCIELESVQRAILYHCPKLVHACVTQAMTRLPLLYVTAPSPPNDSRSQADASVQLHEIINRVVQQVAFDTENSTHTSDENANPNSDEPLPATLTTDDVGPDGVCPILIRFATLEIDGDNNQMLYTVAQNSTGARMLQQITRQLQTEIDRTLVGWTTTTVPSAQGLRLPFMRLPSNWEEFLDRSSPSDFLSSDDGGNGISPILWGRWMDDSFGGDCRMPEIAVYRRQQQRGYENQDAFLFPEQTTLLPRGNEALTKTEKRFQDYQDERMAREELQQQQQQASIGSEHDASTNGTTTSSWDQDLYDDPLFLKTKEKLELLYSTDNPTEASTANNAGKENRSSSSNKSVVASQEKTDTLDDWTRERIRTIVQSRAKVQSEIELSKPKDKVPIEENPVFIKYREGTLVPDSAKPLPPRTLPPFPSREHCVGIWKVISSPTGFSVEENDESRSDNLVLRVDGTTAGGPILDQETRQKAASGTWKLIGESVDNARLRIRLLIPPKKERVLVMEGKLEQLSRSGEFPLAKATFGIPALEKLATRGDDDQDDLIVCSGTVVMEDVNTKLNRQEIGDFSFMKIKTPTDPSQWTITIPRPVRNQD